MVQMIGQGYYGTHTPPAIFSATCWKTRPGIPPTHRTSRKSRRGRLEALLNFQTMVADLTGLPVANASLLDEATACAEAMVMAERVAKSKARGFFRGRSLPSAEYRGDADAGRTAGGIEIIVGAPEDLDPKAVFGAIFQYPGTYGHLRDVSNEIAALHAEKAVAIVATDLLALTLIREPGAMDADIAVGSAQRFGRAAGLWRAACRLLFPVATR